MAGRSDAGCDASRQDRPSVTVDVVVFGMSGCLDAADDGDDREHEGDFPPLK